ncbi:PhzF family phenazine biosynthesis protein [Caldalkalibacillus salinus]|uniref:PhzF family phenazine biosynthesis protein n=1 Tax=Caldalkalibacillus salinus TaxID=2803787 RepID=UPI0019231B24|nr:PhzF family phenazine biosynthesis protein [Caldalkalibacillus salinus]
MNIYQVDTFSNEMFKGNPAMVCILEENKSDHWMSNLAKELNQPVTAFVSTNSYPYKIRWFTPTQEIMICGHGTLAASFILWETNVLPVKEKIHFHTEAGHLTTTYQNEWIQLKFQAVAPIEVEPHPKLLNAMGINNVNYIGKNKWDYIVEIEKEEELISLKPDFDLISKLPVRGVIVTTKSKQKEYDFISRFFSPAQGINEDQVTGSAHCCLAPYWNNKLQKDEFIAYQASKRGGKIKIKVRGEDIYLFGKAVTVYKGELSSSAV